MLSMKQLRQKTRTHLTDTQVKYTFLVYSLKTVFPSVKNDAKFREIIVLAIKRQIIKRVKRICKLSKLCYILYCIGIVVYLISGSVVVQLFILLVACVSIYRCCNKGRLVTFYERY